MGIEEWQIYKKIDEEIKALQSVPSRDDDDDDGGGGGGGGGQVGPSGDPLGSNWWTDLPTLEGPGQTVVDLSGEDPMIGGWGGMNYDVTMPDNPILDEIYATMSPTEQMQLWDLMANTPSPSGVGSTLPPPPLPPGSSQTGYQPPEVKWITGSYEAAGPNVPDWWRPMVPQSGDDYNRPDAAYSMMMNAMIPFLSPEDQVAVARQLYTIWGNDFSMYKAIQPERQISEEQAMMGIEGPVADEDYFLSAQRAADAITTLSAMRESTVAGNRWKLGPGYKFLQTILSTFKDTGFTTSANTTGIYGELDPLLAQTQQGELSPFGPIAKMLAQPFFSSFQLNPATKTESGDFIFGKPNPWLQF